MDFGPINEKMGEEVSQNLRSIRSRTTMAKGHFFVRLIPPRPTFAFDMSEDERHLMDLHAAYLKGEFEAGRLLLYGPVLAPEGSFGLVVVEAQDEAEVHALMRGDPTVERGLNTYDVSPMRVTGAR